MLNRFPLSKPQDIYRFSLNLFALWMSAPPPEAYNHSITFYNDIFNRDTEVG